MQRRVTPEALKLAGELTRQQGREEWWVCDEYRRRGQEIIARYSPPWINAPDSPPWTGEKELHWRSYAPLKETPDLFLKLARLHQEPNFEEAALAFSHKYGVLGGNSTKGNFPKPYRDNLRNFRDEAKRAWIILKQYEAVVNRDWMAAKHLLIEDEAYGQEHWPFEDSPDMYLLITLRKTAHMINRTV